ncbi:Hypothetical_protein [Hexamita inflata]|uniref:Hypothetical_protein n=1 Tax=Hexamita inflata TaxID=28002 RepID=A0AA86TTA4_9EUKA|nr:Hypothetical protein HINF_LOCUS15240 [Hexamita inflata]
MSAPKQDQLDSFMILLSNSVIQNKRQEQRAQSTNINSAKQKQPKQEDLTINELEKPKVIQSPYRMKVNYCDFIDKQYNTQRIAKQIVQKQDITQIQKEQQEKKQQSQQQPLIAKSQYAQTTTYYQPKLKREIQLDENEKFLLQLERVKQQKASKQQKQHEQQLFNTVFDINLQKEHHLVRPLVISKMNETRTKFEDEINIQQTMRIQQSKSQLQLNNDLNAFNQSEMNLRSFTRLPFKEVLAQKSFLDKSKMIQMNVTNRKLLNDDIEENVCALTMFKDKEQRRGIVVEDKLRASHIIQRGIKGYMCE